MHASLYSLRSNIRRQQFGSKQQQLAGGATRLNSWPRDAAAVALIKQKQQLHRRKYINTQFHPRRRVDRVYRARDHQATRREWMREPARAAETWQIHIPHISPAALSYTIYIWTKGAWARTQSITLALCTHAVSIDSAAAPWSSRIN